MQERRKVKTIWGVDKLNWGDSLISCLYIPVIMNYGNDYDLFCCFLYVKVEAKRKNFRVNDPDILIAYCKSIGVDLKPINSFLY